MPDRRDPTTVTGDVDMVPLEISELPAKAMTVMPLQKELEDTMAVLCFEPVMHMIKRPEMRNEHERWGSRLNSFEKSKKPVVAG